MKSDVPNNPQVCNPRSKTLKPTPLPSFTELLNPSGAPGAMAPSHHCRRELAKHCQPVTSRLLTFILLYFTLLTYFTLLLPA